VPAAWAANTKYAVNDIVLDKNGNLEEAATAGTSGTVAPQWPTSSGGNNTVDGSTGLTWQFTSPDYSVSFGTCAAVATQIIVVTNASGAAVTVRGIIATGSSKQFSVTEGVNLAAGRSAPLVVTFTPTQATEVSVTGTLIIETNDPGAPSLAVALSGASGSNKNFAVLTLSAETLTFETESVGKTSAAKPVTLTAGSVVAVSNITAEIFGPNAADFAFQTTCTNLAFNGKCAINVTFTPTQTGLRAALLVINDTAGGSPQTVFLEGAGS
jgi:hypothetical protein